MITSTSKTVGIYTLIHTPTQKFYIGSTVDAYHRYHTHMAQLKRKKTSMALQALWSGNKDEWKIEMLEQCDVSELIQKELQYLQQQMSNPNCLNKRLLTIDNGRGMAKQKQTRMKLVKSMLGKNTEDGIIRRDEMVTLISPDGKKYKVRSINRFAKQFNLHQPALNDLVNGKISFVSGWTAENSELPSIGIAERYWTQERIAPNYPLYTVIGPDNTEYKVHNIPRFEKEHNCLVVTDRGVVNKTRGLNQYGQGYRLSTVTPYTVTVRGVTYDNVISLGQLAKTLGIYLTHFNNVIAGKKIRIPITIQ